MKSIMGGVTTYYVGNTIEWTGNTSTMVKYYYAGSQRVAMRTGSAAPLFLMGDHLGSTSVTADSSGGKVAELRYTPWGGTRYTSGATPTSYQYTGQRNDAYIKLYHMGARMYDPELGRFISPDSIIPDPTDPQNFNRYSYVLNNPLRYTDPTGHEIKLTGSEEDTQRTIDTLNQGVYGYTVTIDEEGKLHITADEIWDRTPASQQQQNMNKWLLEMINDTSGVAEIHIGSNTPIAAGAYHYNAIDISDIEKFGSPDFGATTQGTLMHEISEQYAKQVLGMSGSDEQFQKAHAYASNVEGEAMGAIRDPTRRRQYIGDRLYVSLAYIYDDCVALTVFSIKDPDSRSYLSKPDFVVEGTVVHP